MINRINNVLDQTDTPSFVVDTEKLIQNCEIIADVRKNTGAKILLATKAFSMYHLFPTIAPFLDGTSASSLHEARLGKEDFGKEVHIFSPAYTQKDFPQILTVANHIIFNSFSQYEHFLPYIKKQSKTIECGIRINPEHREVEQAIYDPCANNSRLGVTQSEFQFDSLDGITGLHFHTLCEKNADALARTLKVVESKFGQILHQMKWVNFGGGHHITRVDYDVDLLCRLINDFQDKYQVQVILEPGEAVALNAGFLVASVVDIIRNDMDIAILDTSAATHMPDVLEMPYRPEIIGAGTPSSKEHTYRLGGPSCLAGDVIGDYSFDKPLQIGQKLIFTDMAHYSMVKTNTFNGIQLPSIGIIDDTGNYSQIKQFGYEDFKSRL